MRRITYKLQQPADLKAFIERSLLNLMPSSSILDYREGTRPIYSFISTLIYLFMDLWIYSGLV